MEGIRHPYYGDVVADPTAVVDMAAIRDNASCTQLPYEIFYYPDEEESGGRTMWLERTGSGFGTDDVYDFLRGFCAGCPVVDDCFTHAVFYEQHGFWGGTSPPDRKRLREDYGITLRHMYDPDVRDAEILAERDKIERWGEECGERGGEAEED
jgi:hypothetical protein